MAFIRLGKGKAARPKSPDDTAIWHKVHRAYMWDERGYIHFSDTPKYLSSLSKAKARVRCDFGLDLHDVEFRSRRQLELTIFD
jgi:hypothetical protein